MPKHTKTSRKALFRAALALNEITAAEWAHRNGVTGGAVSMNLSGYRSSDELTAKIDAFIEQHMGKRTTALVA